MRVRYQRADRGTAYEVWSSIMGGRLGTVRKVDGDWHIDGVTGFNTGATGPGGKHHYPTRTEAVSALLRYLNRTDLTP